MTDQDVSSMQDNQKLFLEAFHDAAKECLPSVTYSTILSLASKRFYPAKYGNAPKHTWPFKLEIR